VKLQEEPSMVANRQLTSP